MNITSMRCMFGGFVSLQQLSVDTWNVRKVMFLYSFTVVVNYKWISEIGMSAM